MDLTEAKQLISDSLTNEQMAGWFQQQNEAKAIDLLSHVTNAENFNNLAQSDNQEVAEEATKQRDLYLLAIQQLSPLVAKYAEAEKELRSSVVEENE